MERLRAYQQTFWMHLSHPLSFSSMKRDFCQAAPGQVVSRNLIPSSLVSRNQVPAQLSLSPVFQGVITRIPQSYLGRVFSFSFESVVTEESDDLDVLNENDVAVVSEYFSVPLIYCLNQDFQNFDENDEGEIPPVL